MDYREIVYVGVIELISELKDKGVKLAIASSGRKQSVINVLKELDIFKNFDFIMTGDDVIKSKPDPEIYLRTAQALQTDIKKCIVIEDSFAGISSAVDAGAFVIAKEEKRFGYSQDKSDVICKDFNEIRNCIFEKLSLKV